MSITDLFLNMNALLLLYVLLIAVNIKSIKRYILLPDRRYIVLFSLSMIFFLVLYWFFVPNMLRIFGDEPALIHGAIDYGGEIHRNSLLISIYHYNILIFGNSIYAILKMQVLLSILSLFILFVILYNLLKDETYAFSGPVLLASMPFFIAMATSAYMAIIPFFFFLLSMIFLIVAIRKGDWISFVLVNLGVLLLPLGRIEYIVVFPIAISFYVFRYIHKDVWKKILFSIMMFILFLFFAFVPIYREIDQVFDSMDIRSFSLYNITDNKFGFGWESLMIYILFAALMIFYLIWARKKKVLANAIFIISLTFGFSLIYHMNFYFAPWFFIPTAAFSLHLVASPLLFFLSSKRKGIIIVLIFLLSLAILILGFRLSVMDTYTDPKGYFYTRLPEMLNPIVDKECSIITSYLPFTAMGTGIISYSVVDVLDDESIFLGCLYFFEDSLCVSDPHYVEYCERLLLEHDWEVSANFWSEYDNRNFTLYRLR